MKNIAVFYHVYKGDNWTNIYDEQYDLLEDNGLSENLFINFACDEGDTLKKLVDFSKDNIEYNILYLHTKGTYANTIQNDDWRKMMNYFCIERYEKALSFLDKHDAVGCNLKQRPYLHFSGNFWWSKAKYIQSCNSGLLSTSDRYDREKFIGTGNGLLCSLFDSYIDHYADRFPEKNYK